jgi:hypothetical protein
MRGLDESAADIALSFINDGEVVSLSTQPMPKEPPPPTVRPSRAALIIIPAAPCVVRASSPDGVRPRWPDYAPGEPKRPES